MSETPLFDGYEPATYVDPELSAGRRLTLRQAEMVKVGVHPLMKGSLHKGASTTAKATDPKNLPFTCGSCVHRDAHGYPSCEIGPKSHGPATDVRAWWPGCDKWEES